MFYKTYVLNTKKTTHYWCKHVLRRVVPCNWKMYGRNLVRCAEQPPNGIESGLSRPLNTLYGEPFVLQTQVCLSRGYSNKNKPKEKPRALSCGAAIDKFEKMAGVERVWAEDMPYAKAVPVTDLVVKEIKDVNTFIITGTFRVVDEAKFLTAYNEGVGRRKSYGCGLIIVQ